MQILPNSGVTPSMPTNATPHLLCIGLGYSARALARRLAPRGWRISATATRHESLTRIAALGYGAALYDGSASTAAGSDLAALTATSTHLVVSAPPDATGPDGDPVLRHLREPLAASPTLTTVAYLSTIGVYGDHAGAWIDEDVPVDPRSERSQRRADAERAWLDFGDRTGKSVLVFRLAGIYGPGQSAIDSLRAGTARRIIKPGQVFNRIHVEDIAGVIEAAFLGKPRHRIYNVADDEPAPPQDVIEYAAELLGLPVPPDIPFEQAELSPMGATFYAENKRASNARAKGDLGWRLRYPTYRDGLAAIASSSGGGAIT